MNEYYTILTDYGLSELTRAKADKTPINLSYVVVGDGVILPAGAMTSLKNQKYETPINTLTQDEKNPAYLNIEAVIPMEVGGFYVREVGILDDKKNLFAIGNIPETYKPLLAEGSAKDLVLKIVIEVANASNVELKIDPGAVLATRKWSEVQFLPAIPGQIIAHASNSELKGFLLCDGSEVKREVYKDLFKAIKETYGKGDGATTFNIPDFRGAFLRGFGKNSNPIGTKQNDAIRDLKGNFKTVTRDAKDCDGKLFSRSKAYSSSFKIGKADNWARIIEFDASKVTPTSNEIRPVNFAVNYFIKY